MGHDTRIGFHVSIEGGLHRAADRARERHCTAFQIFCGNPRGWRLQERNADDLDRFREARAEAGLTPLVVHSCYLINPCSADPDVLSRSVQRLSAELELSHAIGADFYVLHPGSHKGKPPEWGVERAAESISEAICGAAAGPTLLLEGMAGPHGPGGDLARLAALIEGIDRRVDHIAIGLAVDSCHLFGAGYDLRDGAEVDRLVEDVQAGCGLGSLRLIHVNDSRDEPGSKRDRHEHIGEGTIGAAGLDNLLNHPSLRGLPLILETPWESAETDRRNLQKVRAILRT